METSTLSPNSLVELDRALNQPLETSSEPAATPQPQRSSSSRLPRALRAMGAAVLLASAGAFLLQGWGAIDHIFRYYGFLGFTVVIALAAFFCGLRIKEDKGARTLLAIAAAIIPVHFCQLGALLYSTIGGTAPGIPTFLRWVAPDTTSAILAIGAGLAVLTPIALTSFMALWRSQAGLLTFVYMAANATLLVPTRDPDLVAGVSLALLLGTLAFDSRTLRPLPEIRTAEGTFCRTMLMTPFALMIARSLQLYPSSLLLVSSLFAAAAVILYVYLPRYMPESGHVSQGLSTVPAAISWTLLCLQIFLSTGTDPLYQLPILGLGFSCILLGMSFHAVSPGQGYRKTAALVAIFVLLVQLLAHHNLLSSTMLVAVGIVVTSYGYSNADRTVFFSGMIGLAFGLLYHLRYALDFYAFSPWLSLGTMGLAAVVGASYLERYRERIEKLFRDFQARLSAQEPQS